MRRVLEILGAHDRAVGHAEVIELAEQVGLQRVAGLRLVVVGGRTAHGAGAGGGIDRGRRAASDEIAPALEMAVGAAEFQRPHIVDHMREIEGGVEHLRVVKRFRPLAVERAAHPGQVADVARREEYGRRGRHLLGVLPLREGVKPRGLAEIPLHHRRHRHAAIVRKVIRAAVVACRQADPIRDALVGGQGRGILQRAAGAIVGPIGCHELALGPR